MNLTIEELLNKLLEIASKRGGEIPTNVVDVRYSGPQPVTGKSETIVIVEE